MATSLTRSEENDMYDVAFNNVLTQRSAAANRFIVRMGTDDQDTPHGAIASHYHFQLRNNGLTFAGDICRQQPQDRKLQSA